MLAVILNPKANMCFLFSHVQNAKILKKKGIH